MFDKLASIAYAQPDKGGTSGLTNSGFQLKDFNFLKIQKADSNTFNTTFGILITLVLTIAALVAFIYLLIAGFQYITAGGDAAKAQTARTGIINALIGIVVILISYTILRYVAGLDLVR